jgi:hypothetical protein
MHQLPRKANHCKALLSGAPAVLLSGLGACAGRIAASVLRARLGLAASMSEQPASWWSWMRIEPPALRLCSTKRRGEVALARARPQAAPPADAPRPSRSRERCMHASVVRARRPSAPAPTIAAPSDVRNGALFLSAKRVCTRSVRETIDSARARWRRTRGRRKVRRRKTDAALSWHPLQHGEHGASSVPPRNWTQKGHWTRARPMAMVVRVLHLRSWTCAPAMRYSMVLYGALSAPR